MTKTKSQTSEEKVTSETVTEEPSVKKEVAVKEPKNQEVTFWSKNKSAMIAYNTGESQQTVQGGIIQLTPVQKWVKFENNFFKTSDKFIIAKLDETIENAVAKGSTRPCIRYEHYERPEEMVTFTLLGETITCKSSEVDSKVQEVLKKQNSEIKTQ